MIYEGDLSITRNGDPKAHVWRFFGIRCPRGDLSSASDGITTNIAVHKTSGDAREQFLNAVSADVPEMSVKMFNGMLHHFADPFKGMDLAEAGSSSTLGLVENTVCAISRPAATTLYQQFQDPSLNYSCRNIICA